MIGTFSLQKHGAGLLAKEEENVGRWAQHVLFP
jgi:hypothetical protein